VYIRPVAALSESVAFGAFGAFGVARGETPRTAIAAGAARGAQGHSAEAEPDATHATQTVRRPDPGLARGLWEAPPSFFYILGGFVVVVAVIYALWRKGIVRFRRTRSPST